MTKNVPTLGLVPVDTFATWAGIDPADGWEEVRLGNLPSVEIDGVTYVRLANPESWRDAWLKRRSNAAAGIVYSLEL